jgi:streptogramin lyase
VADGLDDPVGLAVSDTGDIYVSELQADRISRIAAGTTTATPYARRTFPGDVEWTPDGLVATTDVLSGTNGVDPPQGRLVRLN